MKKVFHKPGEVYNHWTLVEYVSGEKRWKAQCVCGKTKLVYLHHLTGGVSTSCGCVGYGKHRMTDSREYRSWSSMRGRCLSKSNDRYHQYGGRGVTICPDWDSFETFLRDMGYRPEGTSLGRIDNDKGYCKENCRWETPKQQARNRTVTVRIDGESASDISEKLGMKYITLVTRIKRGWSEEDAVNTPVLDKENTVCGMARKLGLNPHTIDCRVRRGWSIDRALSTPIKKVNSSSKCS